MMIIMKFKINQEIMVLTKLMKKIKIKLVKNFYKGKAYKSGIKINKNLTGKKKLRHTLITSSKKP